MNTKNEITVLVFYWICPFEQVMYRASQWQTFSWNYFAYPHLFSSLLSLNLKKNFFSMWGKNEKMVWAISTFSPHSGWFLHFYDWLPPYPVVDELTYTCVIQCYNAKSLMIKLNVSFILRWVCFSLVRLVLFQYSVLIDK